MSLSILVLSHFVGLFDFYTCQKFDTKLRRRIGPSEELIEHSVSSNRTDKKYNFTPGNDNAGCHQRSTAAPDNRNAGYNDDTSNNFIVIGFIVFFSISLVLIMICCVWKGRRR